MYLFIGECSFFFCFSPPPSHRKYRFHSPSINLPPLFSYIFSYCCKQRNIFRSCSLVHGRLYVHVSVTYGSTTVLSPLQDSISNIPLRHGFSFCKPSYKVFPLFFLKLLCSFSSFPPSFSRSLSLSLPPSLPTFPLPFLSSLLLGDQ